MKKVGELYSLTYLRRLFQPVDESGIINSGISKTVGWVSPNEPFVLLGYIKLKPDDTIVFVKVLTIRGEIGFIEVYFGDMIEYKQA